MVERLTIDDMCPDDAKKLISLAVGFLAATEQNHWGDSAFPTNTDFCAIRPALTNTFSATLQTGDMPTAAMQFVRALSILSGDPGNPSGIDDLYDALQAADRCVTATTKTTENGSKKKLPQLRAEESILCFQIMCACFIILRDSTAALASIHAQLEHLLTSDATIRKSLRNLRKCLSSLSSSAASNSVVTVGKIVLFREDKARLDLLFSRICAVLAVCERLEGFELFRPKFHALLSEHVQGYRKKEEVDEGLNSKAAADDDDEISIAPSVATAADNDDLPQQLAFLHDEAAWESLRVYKMGGRGTVAAAAIPAAAMLLVDPLTIPLALGSVALAMKLPVLTKPLCEFDMSSGRPNFYHLRQKIRNVCSGRSVYAPPPPSPKPAASPPKAVAVAPMNVDPKKVKDNENDEEEIVFVASDKKN